MILFLGVCGPPWFFPFRVSTLKSCVSVSCAISIFVLCLSAFYFTFPAPEHPNEKPVVAGHDSRQSGIRANNTGNGRIVRRHVEAHRLQLLSVEVKDEGYAGG